jgi:hypothetical protein
LIGDVERAFDVAIAASSVPSAKMKVWVEKLGTYGSGTHDQIQWNEEAMNSIIVTWKISFEQIRSSAADLLSLISFFDRRGVFQMICSAPCTESIVENFV